MMHRVAKALTWTPVTLVSLLVIVAILGPAMGDGLKHLAVRAVATAAPVKHDWRVSAMGIDGNDVILSGSMVKRWSCEYQPPPRAVDGAGSHYLVVSSSATKTSNWPVTGEPYSFGPWRIVGAAGKKLAIYQEDECLGVSVFSWLGAVDTRSK